MHAPQSFIDRFRYNANRAALVQSRIKALERLADVEVMETDPEYVFNFPAPDTIMAPPIISFNDVSFAYPGGKTLFTDLSFGLDFDSRCAVARQLAGTPRREGQSTCNLFGKCATCW